MPAPYVWVEGRVWRRRQLPLSNEWRHPKLQQSTRSASQVSITPTCFRFFDLPPELRCLIYEYLPINTTRYTIKLEHPAYERSPKRGDTKPILTLLIKTLLVQIPRTCQQIYDEAKLYLDKSLEIIRQATPRMTMDSEAWRCLVARDYVLHMVMQWFDILQNAPYAIYQGSFPHMRLAPSEAVTRFAYQAGQQMLFRWQKSRVGQEGHLGNTVTPLFLCIKIRASARNVRSGIPVNPIPLASRSGLEALRNIVRHTRNAMPRSLHACTGVMQELPPRFFHGVDYETCLLRWYARLDPTKPLHPMQSPRTVLESDALFRNLRLMHGWDGDDVLVHKAINQTEVRARLIQQGHQSIKVNYTQDAIEDDPVDTRNIGKARNVLDLGNG